MDQRHRVGPGRAPQAAGVWSARSCLGSTVSSAYFSVTAVASVRSAALSSRRVCSQQLRGCAADNLQMLALFAASGSSRADARRTPRRSHLTTRWACVYLRVCD